MKRYRVSGMMTISVSVVVEAKSKKAALDEATGAGVMGLCHQCSNSSHGEWCTSGELDGDPVGPFDVTELD